MYHTAHCAIADLFDGATNRRRETCLHYAVNSKRLEGLVRVPHPLRLDY
jgi:hypothetical protein